MRTHDRSSDHQRWDQQGSDAGQEHDNDSQNDKSAERFAVGKRTAKEDHGLIGRAEEVEEDPSA